MTSLSLTDANVPLRRVSFGAFGVRNAWRSACSFGSLRQTQPALK